MDDSLQRALSGISAVFVIWLVFVAVAFCARKYHPAELLDRNFRSDTDEAAAHQHTESFNVSSLSGSNMVHVFQHPRLALGQLMGFRARRKGHRSRDRSKTLRMLGPL